MRTPFLIEALTKDDFQELMLKDDEALKVNNASWLTADADPGYPCRVSLTDAKIGEKVLVLPFCHHNVDAPYKASGPIFVRENAEMAKLEVNEVPLMLRHRLLSLRAYNSKNRIIDAQVAQGETLEAVIERQFRDQDVAYIHIHNAGPGCFNCSVSRA